MFTNLTFLMKFPQLSLFDFILRSHMCTFSWTSPSSSCHCQVFYFCPFSLWHTSTDPFEIWKIFLEWKRKMFYVRWKILLNILGKMFVCLAFSTYFSSLMYKFSSGTYTVGPSFFTFIRLMSRSEAKTLAIPMRGRSIVRQVFELKPPTQLRQMFWWKFTNLPTNSSSDFPLKLVEISGTVRKCLENLKFPSANSKAEENYKHRYHSLNSLQASHVRLSHIHISFKCPTAHIFHQPPPSDPLRFSTTPVHTWLL